MGSEKKPSKCINGVKKYFGSKKLICKKKIDGVEKNLARGRGFGSETASNISSILETKQNKKNSEFALEVQSTLVFGFF